MLGGGASIDQNCSLRLGQHSAIFTLHEYLFFLFTSYNIAQISAALYSLNF